MDKIGTCKLLDGSVPICRPQLPMLVDNYRTSDFLLTLRSAHFNL